MENSQRIAFVVADSVKGVIAPFGRPIEVKGGPALDDFAATLQGFGLEVSLKPLPRGRTEVEVRYPTSGDAECCRSRLAGRRVTYSSAKSPVFDCDTTAAEALAWLDDHSVEEGMRALCCSRSTYYRWRDRLRERVASRAELDARRAAAGDEPYPPLSLDVALSHRL